MLLRADGARRLEPTSKRWTTGRTCRRSRKDTALRRRAAAASRAAVTRARTNRATCHAGRIALSIDGSRNLDDLTRRRAPRLSTERDERGIVDARKHFAPVLAPATARGRARQHAARGRSPDMSRRSSRTRSRRVRAWLDIDQECPLGAKSASFGGEFDPRGTFQGVRLNPACGTEYSRRLLRNSARYLVLRGALNGARHD